MGKRKFNIEKYFLYMIGIFFITLFIGLWEEKTMAIFDIWKAKISEIQDEEKWICYPVLATALWTQGDYERLVPIYRVATDEKKVSISFDAAWGADKTPKILQILRKHQVKTTFFLVKFWAEKYPDMVKSIVSEGHELGNHSATHPDMREMSEEEIIKELLDTHKVLSELSGQNPFLFRPPFGAYSNKVINAAAKANYVTIQWSVDSLDWKDLSAQAISERVLKRVRSGDIILFHNNGKHTVEAIEIILSELEKQGYKIVPISELIYKENYYIDKSTGEQRPKLSSSN